MNVLARPGGFPAFTVANLAAAGVRRISLGSSLARTAYGAFVLAAREIPPRTARSHSAAQALPDREASAFMSDRKRP